MNGLLKKSDVSSMLYEDTFRVTKTGAEIKEKVNGVIAKIQSNIDGLKLKMDNIKLRVQPDMEFSTYYYRGYDDKIPPVKNFSYEMTQYPPRKSEDMPQPESPVKMMYISEYKSDVPEADDYCQSEEESNLRRQYNELVNNYLEQCIELESAKMFLLLDDKKKVEMKLYTLKCLGF